MRLLFLGVFGLFILFISACNEQPKPKINSNTTENTTTGIPDIDHLSKSIASNPNDALLYLQRGKVFHDNGGYDESINDYNKSISLDTTNPVAFHLLADSYLEYYQSRNAINTMQRASARFPKNIPTLLKLSEFYLILKQIPEAMMTAQSILEVSPQNPDAYYMMGLIFQEMGNIDRAIANFQKAVQEAPDHIDAYNGLGILFNGKKEQIALEYLNNALEIDSSRTDVLYNVAIYYQDRYANQQAIDVYRKIILLDPNFSDAYFNSAVLYFEMDSLDKAYKLADISTDMNPSYAKGYYFKGIVAKKQGKKDLAIELLEHAINFDPSLEGAKQVLNELKQK